MKIQQNKDWETGAVREKWFAERNLLNFVVFFTFSWRGTSDTVKVIHTKKPQLSLLSVYEQTDNSSRDQQDLGAAQSYRPAGHGSVVFSVICFIMINYKILNFK